MSSTIVFLILASIAVISALIVVINKNPVYSVLSLIVTFFAIAGIYLLLNSQFLAIVHIIVYAGAIMVLFLYVIMMLNLNIETEPVKSIGRKALAFVGGGLLLLVLVAAFRTSELKALPVVEGHNIGTVENLGKTLFTTYLVPFEISAILFLAAMVGAVLLGKKELE